MCTFRGIDLALAQTELDQDRAGGEAVRSPTTASAGTNGEIFVLSDTATTVRDSTVCHHQPRTASSNP
ncbi:hypothetical protein A5765_02370 [Mycolicibacterium celeriflavum]|nr:hypothetical protein A5765_02370 [Mycolicibacterium celeriflavum]